MRGVSAAADERGAVVVTVALSFTVFLAAIALLLDGGAIRDEGAQLQNGADAAALALARDCAFELPTCSTTSSVLRSYLDANSDDGRSDGTATFAGTTVTVRATPRDAETGAPNVPYKLASIIGISSGTTSATSTASWIPRVRRPFVEIPIARCEFDQLTDGGTTTRYRSSRTKPVVKPLGMILYRRGGCDDVPDGLDASDPDLGPFTVETKCNPPSGCSDEDMAPLIGQEVVVSIWHPEGRRWVFDGFAGFEVQSYFRNNGHKVGTGLCTEGGAPHDCLSGRFTRTSRRDGQPGGYVLGGEVELTK
jgi:Flp pilus assembly protein TadG